MAKDNLYHPKLAAYWGIIQSAVNERVTTADLWRVVQDAASEEGADLSGVRISDMSRIRSLAVSIRNSSEAFMNADENAAIDANMVSQNINSRSLLDQNTVPIYQVRFEQLVLEGEEANSVWRTVTYTGDLPTTKAALLDELDIGAEDLANSYGQQHVGIGQVIISVV